MQLRIVPAAQLRPGADPDSGVAIARPLNLHAPLGGVLGGPANERASGPLNLAPPASSATLAGGDPPSSEVLDAGRRGWRRLWARLALRFAGDEEADFLAQYCADARPRFQIAMFVATIASAFWTATSPNLTNLVIRVLTLATALGFLLFACAPASRRARTLPFYATILSGIGAQFVFFFVRRALFVNDREVVYDFVICYLLLMVLLYLHVPMRAAAPLLPPALALSAGTDFVGALRAGRRQDLLAVASIQAFVAALALLLVVAGAPAPAPPPRPTRPDLTPAPAGTQASRTRWTCGGGLGSRGRRSGRGARPSSASSAPPASSATSSRTPCVPRAGPGGPRPAPRGTSSGGAGQAAGAPRAPREALAAAGRLAELLEAVAEAHGLLKIKSIGLTFMARPPRPARPPPRPAGPADRAARGAQGVVGVGFAAEAEAAGPGRARRRRTARREGFPAARAGLFPGALVSGVIGCRLAFDVFGDACNLAQRMCAHGEAGRVHLPAAARDAMLAAGAAGALRFSEPAATALKGRGTWETCFVSRAGGIGALEPSPVDLATAASPASAGAVSFRAVSVGHRGEFVAGIPSGRSVGSSRRGGGASGRRGTAGAAYLPSRALVARLSPGHSLRHAPGVPPGGDEGDPEDPASPRRPSSSRSPAHVAWSGVEAPAKGPAPPAPGGGGGAKASPRPGEDKEDTGAAADGAPRCRPPPPPASSWAPPPAGTPSRRRRRAPRRPQQGPRAAVGRRGRCRGGRAAPLVAPRLLRARRGGGLLGATRRASPGALRALIAALALHSLLMPLLVHIANDLHEETRLGARYAVRGACLVPLVALLLRPRLPRGALGTLALHAAAAAAALPPALDYCLLHPGGPAAGPLSWAALTMTDADACFATIFVCTLGQLPLPQKLPWGALPLLASAVPAAARGATADRKMIPVWLGTVALAMWGVAFLREREARRRFLLRNSARRAARAAAEAGAEADALVDLCLPRAALGLLPASGREAVEFERVAVLQSDIVGFSGIAPRTDAPRLVDALNALFAACDEIAERYGVQTLRTVGDAWVGVVGLDRPAGPRELASLLRAAHEMRAAYARTRLLARQPGVDPELASPACPCASPGAGREWTHETLTARFGVGLGRAAGAVVAAEAAALVAGEFDFEAGPGGATLLVAPRDAPLLPPAQKHPHASTRDPAPALGPAPAALEQPGGLGPSPSF
eukprot:tig00001335_g8215.t1